jgi:hypothetical protein
VTLVLDQRWGRSWAQRTARLVSQSRRAGALDRGEQLLDRSSSRPAACLQLQDVEHFPSVGIERGGKKLVGSG